MAEEKVVFSGRVPKSEADFFRLTFPQYGSVNWFIETCLKRFNDKVKSNISLVDQIDQAIDEAIKR